MLKKFIDRPILATVVSLLLILLGVVGITGLPITRFPEIAPPSVVVSASYPGADAETIAESVLLPLESKINGVEDMDYIKSSASTGSGHVSIYFKQGTDPNQAAVNVQTRASKANEDLPAEVIENGLTVMPRQKGVIATLNVYSDDPAFDETFLQSYTNRQVIRELKRIDGIAEVSRMGGRNYAMRIWLNPDKLKAYDLVPNDIKDAVKGQNFEVAPGEFGKSSDQAFEITIKYTGRFKSAEEFGNIILKTTKDGSILHLNDVARVELGPTNLNAENHVDGKPGLTMDITQNSGANAREIDFALRKKMKSLAENFPKGIKYDISYSVREQIDESVDQVLHTLVEAFILVFIIVFIFLQDFRATIIPAISIPVSLIGTFFFIYLLGFSINVLTLFALVLSIGIVVDDAIVVVEAIHHKMDSTTLSPRKATKATMGEITPAILSITMVMSAVFLPIGFMQGPSGVFYRQFAYTMAMAILISALNALTLSPALCALFLKRAEKPEDQLQNPPLPERTSRSRQKKAKDTMNRFFTGFNTAFTTMTNRYVRAIVFLIKKQKWAIGGLIIVAVIGILLMRSTPTAFIPNEDDGFIMYSLELPPGSSLARTTNVLNKTLDILKTRKEIKSLSSSSGFNGVDGTTSTSYAMGYINMYPHGKRKGVRDINKFMDTLRKELSKIKGADVSVFTRPTVEGFGKRAGINVVLEDRLDGDFQALGSVSQDLITELNKRPEILKASTTFNANFPQYELDIDREKAKVLGVDIRDMMDNIRQYYSRVRVSEFNLFNRLNRVYVEADPKYTETPASLNSIYVRSKEGNMVPVSTLVKLRRTFGPEIVTRYSMFNSVEIKGIPAKGYSSGDAMQAVKETTADMLPGNYQYEWSGLSREEEKSGGQGAFILLLSLAFVYLLLAAQYESYLLPLSILLSIPVGLIGVYGAVNLVGLQNNIYVQVGLIMLIGLLAKNAILIVEYSEQHRQRGNSILHSAIAGAHLRLRPILMTSFAFIMGMVPLMWTTGSSAQGNHSISFAAAGGMISGVVLGIFIIPVLFILFKTWDEKLKKKFKKVE